MKVLIMPSWYKTDENPVLGSFFEEQARGLMNLGHDVGLLFPKFLNYSSPQKKYSKTINDNGLPTWYYYFKAPIPQNLGLTYKLYQNKIYRIYKNYVSKYGKPDIIHAHTVFYGGIAAMYIARKENIPFVLTEHFTPFITGGIQRKLDINIAKKIFDKTQTNIIVSSGFKEMLADKLELKKSLFQVIPNMVDSDFFEIDLKEDFDPKMPRFFTVSFLSERKNVSLMLNAFRILVDKVPNAIFEIGGEGQIAEKLKAEVKAQDLEKNVVFLGPMSRQDVKSKMGEIDIFLLASTFETFGVVLIEALAVGVPVISTDSVGPRDIIRKNNGILVSDFDERLYFQAMSDLVANYSFYNKDLIRKDCYNKYSEKSIMLQVEALYVKSISEF